MTMVWESTKSTSTTHKRIISENGSKSSITSRQRQWETTVYPKRQWSWTEISPARKEIFDAQTLDEWQRALSGCSRYPVCWTSLLVHMSSTSCLWSKSLKSHHIFLLSLQTRIMRVFRCAHCEYLHKLKTHSLLALGHLSNYKHLGSWCDIAVTRRNGERGQGVKCVW